ncbi:MULTISPECIES: DUF58 domain-containing protein [unclassified Haematobacter]|uniref:DUF58 domain-containing protein n=1 Tax=unclassified Haematobacter TaxID=2640585 RepID=UPI0025BBB17A|nr:MULTISPECIES: DUF58 domain-containing protein [unclassified Haematobacter]
MPTPALMDRLSTMRLMPPGARAGAGIGDQASRARGAGLEFADFRGYRPGDDLRHIDPRSLARGEPFTREYMQRRQLSVTVVLDLTLSMTVDDGAKAALASGVARALGFLALAGQDRLRLVVLEADGSVRRSPVWQGRNRAPEMFDFAERRVPPQDRAMDPVPAPLATALSNIGRDNGGRDNGGDAGAVVFVLSDFWEPDAVAALDALAQAPAMVAALQILSAQERDPASLGYGVLRLVDAETGRERDVTVDEDMLNRYRSALGRHQDALAAALSDGRHLFLPLAAEDQLTDICLKRLPATGIVA